ncbi:MAG: hypothetical protein EZS28_028473, partial [Streblomastix strix]
MATPLQT